MAASAWSVVNAVPERMGNAEFNFDTDAFVVRLYNSSSNISDTSDDATAVTNELSTEFGYTAGGYTVTPGWTRSGAVSTFDISDPTWTAAGGSIVARWAAIVDTTATPDRVIAWTLLDTAPDNVTTTTGNVLTIQISASGVFTITV
jgi:hypothetical protein